jgi:AhpD family alkylhydroperoxidase
MRVCSRPVANHPDPEEKAVSARLQAFRAYRERMNAQILDEATLTTKRFFNLDTRCYEDGALSARTKEMLGLSASLVLRCDDCIAYHTIRCVELGVSKAEILEIFDVGLIVGGSIVIPHLRRAHELLAELLAGDAPSP